MSSARIVVFAPVVLLAAAHLAACQLECPEGVSCGLEATPFEPPPEPMECDSLDCYEPPVIPKGWDDPPGTGKMFVINQLAIAGQNRGFDLDGDGSVDNAFWQVGELGNDQTRQSLLGGEHLILVEVAGLDPANYKGGPDSLTVKIYNAFDADDPIFPANNFKVPPGHVECCQFLIDATSLNSTPQALTRIAAVVSRGRVIAVDPSPYARLLDFELRGALISFRLPSSLREISEAVVGGGMTFSYLAGAPNPYCQIDSPSPRCTGVAYDNLLAFTSVVIGARADLDLDGDGLECLVDQTGSGGFACCDGAGEQSCTEFSGACRSTVEAQDPSTPVSCAYQSQIQDAYSASLTFTAVEAFVVGVR